MNRVYGNGFLKKKERKRKRKIKIINNNSCIN